MKRLRGTNALGRAAGMSAAWAALGEGGTACLLGCGASGAGGTACLLGRGVDGWGRFCFGVADIGGGRPPW